MAFIQGTNNNDTLNGDRDTLINDIILGLAGDDILNGLNGNDYLFGGDGFDRISGGDGNDYVDGGNDINILNGNAGNDIIIGGISADTIQGGFGNDTLNGNLGNDILSGVDPLNGTSNGIGERDTLTGGAGPDDFRLDYNGINYNDNNPNTPGTNDYALITDFFPTSQLDLIILPGTPEDYSIGTTPVSAGTAIFLTKGQTTPELITVILGETFTTLNTSTGFIFSSF